MRPPARSSAAAVLWPAAASGSNSRWRRAPCVGARRTCVPPRKYSLARTHIRAVSPRTNPPSLFSCAPHLQPTVTGRQGRSCANNRWAIPEHQSGPKNNIEATLYGRQFFETVIGDNLDLGRPDRVNLLFPTRLTRRTPPPRGGYHTRVITTGVAPSLHISYKHTDIKQYFKLGCALRTETTINDAKDFQPTKALETLGNLRTIGKQTNHRLLDAERLNHACSLQPSRFERLQQPIVLGNRRVSALRFGDPRVHALLQAISHFTLVPEGFQNRDLRPLVAALLGRELDVYSRGAMMYDLRRLRLHGLIQRVPRTHRYIVALDGLQIAS